MFIDDQCCLLIFKNDWNSVDNNTKPVMEIMEYEKSPYCTARYEYMYKINIFNMDYNGIVIDILINMF